MSRGSILDQVLTAAEADEMYGMGKGTTRKYCHLGRFKEKRQSGSTWLVTKAECEFLYGKTSGSHENGNDWPIEVPANENHGNGNFVPEIPVIVNDENVKAPESVIPENENGSDMVKSAIAGRRKTVHVLRQDGKPLCGSISVPDLTTVRERAFVAITCTHCQKWYKLK